MKKNLQDKVGVSWVESTQTCDACETFKEKDFKPCL